MNTNYSPKNRKTIKNVALYAGLAAVVGSIIYQGIQNSTQPFAAKEITQEKVEGIPTTHYRWKKSQEIYVAPLSVRDEKSPNSATVHNCEYILQDKNLDGIYETRIINIRDEARIKQIQQVEPKIIDAYSEQSKP